MAYRKPARTTTRRIRIRRIRAAGLLVVIAAIAGLGYQVASSSSTAASSVDVLRSEHRGGALPSAVWPTNGQAAVQIGQSQIHAGPNQHAAAIASVAKVMTAYLVLRDHPLRLGQDGPTITLTDADVADTDRRRRQQESVVSIAAGEQLTERQALQALLLPSANNIAAVLARWDAGSTDRFVARMNATARALGMIVLLIAEPLLEAQAIDPGLADLILTELRLPRTLLVLGYGAVLGISGAALAMLISQTVTLLAMLVLLYRRKHFLCIHRNELHFLRMDLAIVKVLVSEGDEVTPGQTLVVLEAMRCAPQGPGLFPKATRD